VLGHCIFMLSNNKSLAYFLSSKEMNWRQARWYEYLSQFDFKIKYVKGVANLIPDALSHQYESDDESTTCQKDKFVSMDMDLEALEDRRDRFAVHSEGSRPKREHRNCTLFDDKDSNMMAKKCQEQLEKECCQKAGGECVCSRNTTL